MFNHFKTVLLLGAMTGLFLAAGELLGGRGGMFLGLGFAAVMNFVGFFFSDKIALAAHRAQPLDEASAPELYQMVRQLTLNASLPMPRLYVIPEQQPNAFATGRSPKHAAVAVTQGLLTMMSREELEGVIAHELAHVKNRDILISSIAATLAGGIAFMARMAMWGSMFGGRRGRGGNPFAALLVMILAPIAAMVVQMAVSRSREYAADATGAEIARSPWGLISALDKLGSASARIPMATARDSTAHMMIASPLRGGGLKALFSTHPPMAERIRRLQAGASVTVV